MFDATSRYAKLNVLTLTVTDPDDLDLMSATVSVTGGIFANDGELVIAAGTPEG